MACIASSLSKSKYKGFSEKMPVHGVLLSVIFLQRKMCQLCNLLIAKVLSVSGRKNEKITAYKLPNLSSADVVEWFIFTHCRR